MPVLVSVIIPTHKRASLLRRAVQSVLEQTYTSLEIIVVENGESSEGKVVIEVFRRLHPGVPFRYVYQRQGSLPRARNAGICAARGEHLAFLDDDDVWLPTKLERQVAVLDHDPGIGLVTCRAWLVNEKGEVMGERPRFRGGPDVRRSCDAREYDLGPIERAHEASLL
jgi:glycosyltransferase involved in cell wall biosynthesis